MVRPGQDIPERLRGFPSLNRPSSTCIPSSTAVSSALFDILVSGCWRFVLEVKGGWKLDCTQAACRPPVGQTDRWKITILPIQSP